MDSVSSRASASALLIALLCLFAVQPAWADDIAIGQISPQNWFVDNGHTSYDEYDDETSYYFSENDKKVYAEDVTSGSADYNPSTHTLTLYDIECYEVRNDFGPIEFRGTCDVDYIDGTCDIVIPSGATLIQGFYSWHVNNVTLSGGTIDDDISCGGNFTMKSGTVNGSLSCKGNFAMSGGTINANVSCEGNFTMKGGIITKPISCSRNFNMSGGSISLTNSNGYISVGSQSDIKPTAYTMTITGGTITSKAPSNYGLYLNSANLVLKGGVINVSNAYWTPICVSPYTFRGKTYGGKINAKKGSITATLAKGATSSTAISARSMSNSISVLKSIRGSMPPGASFKAGGNEYSVNRSTSYVSIMNYGASKTSIKLDKVKFGGQSYYIEGVGSDAFNTPAGKKLTSIFFRNSVSSIGKNAFANTQALTQLRLGYLPTKTKNSKSGGLKSIRFTKDAAIDKSAFANSGKDGGKSLTLYLDNINYSSSYYPDGRVEYSYPEAAKYKSFLERYGLPSGVTVKPNIR